MYAVSMANITLVMLSDAKHLNVFKKILRSDRYDAISWPFLQHSYGPAVLGLTGMAIEAPY